MEKPTVAVMTDFFDIDEAYSLCTVAGMQIKMLLRGGYKPVVIVDEKFNHNNKQHPWTKDDVEFRYSASVPRGNRVEINDSWDSDIETMIEYLTTALEGIDVVLTHDLIYQPSQVKHHVAARSVARTTYPQIKWLHLIHSATPVNRKVYDAHESLQVLKSPFPNSRIIFPNEADRMRVAENFGYHYNLVEHVPHAIDVAKFLSVHPITEELIDDVDLLSADIISCYPARLDRGKQVEFGIEIMARFVARGLTIRYVIFDFHSTAGDKVAYRKQLKRLTKSLGIEDSVIFMSDYKETKVMSPNAVVRDIMLLSDLYIHPSKSETYSLTAQEAGLSGALLVLNSDFPPMRSIYGGSALYAQFSSNIDALTMRNGETNVDYNDREQYMDWIASRAAGYLMTSPVALQRRRIRKERNLDAVFWNYLEPIFYK